MKTTPITSALKRKYSPFKITAAEKLQQEIEKQSVIVADPQGKAKKQVTYETPGSEGTAPKTERRRTQASLDFEAKCYNPDGSRKRGVPGCTWADEEGTEAPSDYEDVVVDEGSKGTDPSERQEEKPIYTKVTGTGKRAYESREDLRGGKQARRKEKRDSIKLARQEAKGMFPNDKKAQREYIKEQKRLAKVEQAKGNIAQAKAESENFKRMSEEGKTAGQDFYKGQREADISEVQTTREQGGTANSDKSEDEKKTDGALTMRYDMGKFRKMSTKAPLKKLTDLSGDGKITKKDVLIGRGVISKDGSPAKMSYGNKKTPFKMGGYGKKTYK